jgi:hypothetical protein
MTQSPACWRVSGEEPRYIAVEILFLMETLERPR